MNRRGFLTGLLAAPAVITTPGLLMPVKAWSEWDGVFVDCSFAEPDHDAPTFFGDGVNDDQPAIQAAIDGKPFCSGDGGLRREGDNIIIRGGTVRLDDSLHVSGALDINFNHACIDCTHGGALMYVQDALHNVGLVKKFKIG